MEKPKLIISPKTKVGELLDAYPQTEDLLLELSPAFAKLRNPLLRKTVAKVASLQQAAVIGGLKVDELVNRLRKEVGQELEEGEMENSEYISAGLPEWYAIGKVVTRMDATPIINSGGSPMSQILSLAGELQLGEIFELTTPFVPAPIVDMLKSKGFTVASLKQENVVLNYITRS